MNARTQVGDVIINFGVNVAIASFATVVTVTTTGAVKPHFKLVRTIFRQFLTLLKEYLRNVSVLTIVCRVAVPWRDVEAVLHVVLLTCLCKQFRDVCRATVLITRLRNAVRRSSRWPQAETVVVLYHRNTATHTSSLHRSNPLFGIGLCQRSISRFRFVTESPLLTCKGVHAVVEEGIKLCFVPQNLTFVRNRMTWRGRIVRIG